MIAPFTRPGAFNRDLIDRAMIRPTRKLLGTAVSKAQEAYGNDHAKGRLWKHIATFRANERITLLTLGTARV